MKIAEQDSARLSHTFTRDMHRNFERIQEPPLSHALFIPDQRIPAWTRTVCGVKKAPHPMATMNAVDAHDRSSAHPGHIQHRAQAHALSKPI